MHFTFFSSLPLFPFRNSFCRSPTGGHRLVLVRGLLRKGRNIMECPSDGKSSDFCRQDCGLQQQQQQNPHFNSRSRRAHHRLTCTGPRTPAICFRRPRPSPRRSTSPTVTWLWFGLKVARPAMDKAISCGTIRSPGTPLSTTARTTRTVGCGRWAGLRPTRRRWVLFREFFFSFFFQEELLQILLTDHQPQTLDAVPVHRARGKRPRLLGPVPVVQPDPDAVRRRRRHDARGARGGPDGPQREGKRAFLSDSTGQKFSNQFRGGGKLRKFPYLVSFSLGVI